MDNQETKSKVWILSGTTQVAGDFSKYPRVESLQSRIYYAFGGHFVAVALQPPRPPFTFTYVEREITLLRLTLRGGIDSARFCSCWRYRCYKENIVISVPIFSYRLSTLHKLFLLSAIQIP